MGAKSMVISLFFIQCGVFSKGNLRIYAAEISKEIVSFQDKNDNFIFIVTQFKGERVLLWLGVGNFWSEHHLKLIQNLLKTWFRCMLQCLLMEQKEILIYSQISPRKFTSLDSRYQTNQQILYFKKCFEL